MQVLVDVTTVPFRLNRTRATSEEKKEDDEEMVSIEFDQTLRLGKGETILTGLNWKAESVEINDVTGRPISLLQQGQFFFFFFSLCLVFYRANLAPPLLKYDPVNNDCVLCTFVKFGRTP